MATTNEKKQKKGESAVVDPAFLFNTGDNYQAYHYLGAHREGSGWVFRVWAPRAAHVELTGEFSNWGAQEMVKDEATGIWEGRVDEDVEGALYKYRIFHHDGTAVLKADPFAFASEVRPGTASRVAELKEFTWRDTTWLRQRRAFNPYKNPMSIYEVHLGSWMRHPDGSFYTYTELKDRLIPYVSEMGYTHIEIMPIMEHPNDESWGYQVTGFFSPTSRYGTAEMFREFVDAAHQAGIGIILDWVPSHYVTDEHGLRYFDGTATYEHMDYNKAFNEGWGTMHFDFSKHEVQSFLISNAYYYINEFHVDGLRLDAVSSMIYLDYAGKSYIPNEEGGNTDLQALDFLKRLNTIIRTEFPGVLMIAEESTAFEKMTDPIEEGGLGFHYKWNMGWMNDMMKYMEILPEHRVFNQRLVNFSFMYAFKEKYVLPLSHDEVVHGKKSLVEKNPLDLYNKFAGFRLLMSYMYMHPGKKLNFMTNDIAQWMEWRYYTELEWVGLQNEKHAGAQNLMRQLNHLYREERCLYENETEASSIDILDVENPQCLVKFLRRGTRKKDFLACVFNFDFNQVEGVRIGVPYEGVYEELINTELQEFGGAWSKTQGQFVTQKGETDGMPFYIEVISPSLSGLIIRPVTLKGDRRKSSAGKKSAVKTDK